MPRLLNFNGFLEKLICRIKAQLSQGFLLSEHQTLRSPAESANEEQGTSWGSTATAGPASGSPTSAEGTEVPGALFVQGAASHSPLKIIQGLTEAGAQWDVLPAPALPALASDMLGEEGTCLMGIFSTSPNVLLSDFAPLTVFSKLLLQ